MNGARYLSVTKAPHNTESLRVTGREHVLSGLVVTLALILLDVFILIFNHLRLCLATAIHNLKWLKITHICFNWVQIFANLDVQTGILFYNSDLID